MQHVYARIYTEIRAYTCIMYMHVFIQTRKYVHIRAARICTFHTEIRAARICTYLYRNTCITWCMYMHVFIQKYVHIHAYTYLRCHQQGVRNTPYLHVFIGNTCTYGSSQANIRLLWSHIRAHACNICAYICTYNIRHVSMLYGVCRILHVYARIVIESIRAYKAHSICNYTCIYTCTYGVSGSLMHSESSCSKGAHVYHTRGYG